MMTSAAAIVENDGQTDTSNVRARRLYAARLAEWLSYAAAWAVITVIHFGSASPSVGPVVVADEFGYLGSARHFAGAGDSINASGTPFYSPGFPTLAAVPARLFSGDPANTYRWTIALNASLSGLAIVVAAILVGRVMRANCFVALLGAFAAGLLPALKFNSSVALAEPTIALLVPLSIGMVGLVARDSRRLSRGGAARCLAVGLLVGWLPAAHNRLIPMAAVLGAAVLANLVAWRAWNRLAFFVGGVACGATVWQLQVASTTRAVWRDRPDPHEAAIRTALTTRRGIWETLQVMTGQSWSLVVGTAGIAGLAVAALISVVRRADEQTGQTEGGWLKGVAQNPRRVVSAAALLALLAELMVSAGFMAGGFVIDGGLPDMFVYGRYLDVFAPLLIAAGTVAAANLVRRAPDALSAVAVASVVAAPMVLGVLTDVSSDNEFEQGWFNPFSSMNVAAFGTDIWRGTWDTMRVVALVSLIGVALYVVSRFRTVGGPFVAAALLVPVVLAFAAREEQTDWVVGQLRLSAQRARDFSSELRAFGPAEVWIDGSVGIGDRLAIEWWTPNLATELADGCPSPRSSGALLVFSSSEPRSGEVARAGNLAAAFCS